MGKNQEQISLLTPLAAFSQGMRRVWIHKRILLWLYLVNVVFAGVLLYPFRCVLDRVSKTDLADEFLEGFSIDAFVDVSLHFGAELNALGFAALGLGALYLLLNIFLAGGIVATLALDHRVSLHRFLANASRFFSRFLRLFVTFLVTVGAVVAGYSAWLEPYCDDLAKAATTDRDEFLFGALGVVILLFVVSLIAMVFDYAKVRTVVDRRKSMVVCAWSAMTFSVRRFWRCFRLFYLNLLIVVALMALLVVIGNQFSNATFGSIIGLFVVQQVFILCRIGMKLSFFASELAMYAPAALAQAEPEPVAPMTPTMDDSFKPLQA